MSTPVRFMEDVLSMWTNPDAEARAAILRARFTADVRFHDPDGAFVGHAGSEPVPSMCSSILRLAGLEERP